ACYCVGAAYGPLEGAYARLAQGVDARRPLWRLYSAWGAGVLAVYGLSLGILVLYEELAPGGSVTTNFQRGHTNVSALWGLLGLVLLYVRLRRDQRALRLRRFALFVISIGKILSYDLLNLTAVTRARSLPSRVAA